MERKRVVFLFGAGAVIDWGGPKTLDLTEAILDSGFFCKDKKTRITKRIHEVLSQNFNQEEINFETILNVIEELMTFYSSSDYIKSSSMLFPFFDSNEFLDDILNYQVNGKVKHGYSITIPEFTQEYSRRNAYNNQSPNQFFLQTLYVELLSIIIGRISKYSYYTSTKSDVVESENNKERNDLMHQWIIKQVNKSGIVRIYTLNYDRLFSVILKNRGVEIFEGVDCKASLNPGDRIPMNIKRIASDFDSHIHYNLHGSAYWDVESRNGNQLPSIQYCMKGVPAFPENLSEQTIIQLEKGKTIIATNIIAGYQKVQKTALNPFRQMLSAFDRDCLFADKIIIAGYSFGDEHLNESIRASLINNPKIKIEIIDPNFIKNKMDEKLANTIFSSSQHDLSPQKVSETEYSYLNNAVTARLFSFQQFLEFTKKEY